MSCRLPRALPLALLGCVLVGTPLAGEKAPTESAAVLTRALTEAERGLAAGELEIAESRYRTALLEAGLLLGAAEASLGNLDEARAAFEQTTRVAVETRRGRLSLALILIEQGESGQAVGLLRRVVGAHPGDFAARRLMARALMAEDRVDEAVQELAELAEMAPGDLENLYLLARGHLIQQRPEAAAADFARLAEARPIAETHVLIGRTYRDFEAYGRAREALETALALDPRVRRAHYYLGTVELFDRGQALLESAMRHFEQELELYPDDPLSNLYLGTALVELRRHEEAVPHLELAAERGPSPADALQFLGRAYLALDRPGEALEVLRRGLELAEASAAVARGPADARERRLSSLHYQLALALRRTGDEAGAAVQFEAARQSSARSTQSSREILGRYLEGEPEEPASFTSSIGSILLPGWSEAAKRELVETARRALVQAYFNLAVMLTRSERFARGAELFEQAAAIDPDHPRLQYSLGVASFNAGRFEQATAPLSRALADNPGDDALRRMLALAWLNTDSYARAAELLAEDDERQRNPALQYAYGLALVRSGRAAEAEATFERLLRDNPDWAELYVVLGQAHAQQDDYQAATGYLRRALELDPGVAEAHATLGDIFLRQGKLEEAERALRAELRGHPGDRRARYTLAAVLELNRKAGEALVLLRALLRDEPRFADARYLLGKILLAEGAAEEAVGHLEAAAALAPADANIRYQLGQAYQKVGEIDRAARQFETFRQLKRARGNGEGP